MRPNSRYMFTRSRDSSKVEHSVLHKSRVLFIKLTNNFYTRETFNPLLPLPVLLVIIIGKDVWCLYTGSYFYETLCTSFGHNLSPDNGIKLTGQISHAFVFNKHGRDCAPFSIGLHWINNQKTLIKCQFRSSSHSCTWQFSAWLIFLHRATTPFW